MLTSLLLADQPKSYVRKTKSNKTREIMFISFSEICIKMNGQNLKNDLLQNNPSFGIIRKLKLTQGTITIRKPLMY